MSAYMTSPPILIIDGKGLDIPKTPPEYPIPAAEFKVSIDLVLPDGKSLDEFNRLMRNIDRQITQTLLGPLPQAVATNWPSSLIHGLAHVAYTEAKMKEHWQRFLSAYAMPRPELQKPKRPKWGQRGRQRLRKTRLEARAINHLMNDLRRRLQCPKPSSLLTMEPNPPTVM